MGEDRSRIRINPGVFARLRSFAFNILKSNRRSSLAQDRFRAAIGGLDRLNLLRIPGCRTAMVPALLRVSMSRRFDIRPQEPIL